MTSEDVRPMIDEGYGYAIQTMLKLALSEMKRINKILEDLNPISV